MIWAASAWFTGRREGRTIVGARLERRATEMPQGRRTNSCASSYPDSVTGTDSLKIESMKVFVASIVCKAVADI